MSWSKFTIVMAICYLAYYSFNIIFDMLKGSNSVVSDNNGDVLTFTEDVQTTYVENKMGVTSKRVIIANDGSDVEDEKSDHLYDMEVLGTVIENINTSSGGVMNMSDIIKLAQNDTIEFKRSLVF